MIRVIIILMLTMFVFLGGVSYGAKDTEQITPVVTETQVEETYPIIDINEEKLQVAQVADDELTIYQTASWFEKIVTSIYDMVVSIMYQFVELFF